MTARTFGRKGIEVGAIALVPSRRAALLAPPPAAEDEPALRRAAFLAEERTRTAPRPESPALKSEPVLYPQKSLALAYVLWVLMGSLGAHRFYLGRPLTAGIIACAWATSWALVLGQYYIAFAGVLAVGWWVFSDGFLIRRMHRIATTGKA